MLFGGAILFWALMLTIVTLVELSGLTVPDEREKLRIVGGTFALSFLISAIREAATTKERPIMFRLSALLLIANIVCLLSDMLAFDEIDMPSATSSPRRFFIFRRQSAVPEQPKKSNMRFATEHVVATLLALLVHYIFTGLNILLSFVRWRFASLPPAKASAGGASRLRVLIPYANIGSGHKMAALALQAAFARRAAPGVEVILLDVMESTPRYFRYIFQTVCPTWTSHSPCSTWPWTPAVDHPRQGLVQPQPFTRVSQRPAFASLSLSLSSVQMFQNFTQSLVGQHFLGLAYDAADKGRAKSELQKLFERFVSLALIDRVAKIRPDIVLCTHFLPAQVLSGLRHTGSRTLQGQARRLPLALVLTDLDLQFMWVNDVDCYFVPRQTAVHMLEAYGALKSGAAAIVSGIPIYPAFADMARDANVDQNLGKARGTLRLRELEKLSKWAGTSLGVGGWPASADPRPTLLYISSGNAVKDIYSFILASETPMRVLVCTGRQADVRSELEKVPIPPRHAIKMLGFVADNEQTPGGMPTLLRCSDLFVGKSGGLAVAEAAALGVPMIVLDPIPGQEQRNADVLLEAGAAFKINDLPLLPRRIDDALRAGGAKAAQMATCIRTLGRPDAAADIVEAVIARRVQPIYAPASQVRV